MLIAALGWYSGRASLNHSLKNGGTGSAWTILRPRSGKFFSRGNRGGATEFSPFTPSTPAWRTTAYEGGFSPSSNTEAGAPAPTYVSIGDDYGIPTPGAEETDAMRDNTGSQPVRYEVVRTGQAEGMGLLQGGARRVVQRKEISRKPVPGHGNGSGRL